MYCFFFQASCDQEAIETHHVRSEVGRAVGEAIVFECDGTSRSNRRPQGRAFRYERTVDPGSTKALSNLYRIINVFIIFYGNLVNYLFNNLEKLAGKFHANT